MMSKVFCVYIMTNKWNKVLYTGISGDLKKRVYAHKEKLVEGFTKKYNVTKLIYFEVFGSPIDAISREKQIKAGSRNDKLELIKKMNPEWRDLYEEI